MKKQITITKKAVHKIAKVSLSVFLSASIVLGGIPVSNAEAAKAICETYIGDNVEGQNYSRWSSPIESYLTSLDDGSLMRIQYGSQIEGLLVEYYAQDYNITSSKMVTEELPIFGGFYATDSNYFVVTGQTNTEESDAKEVYRITKYDKDWNKIKSVGLGNCNTTVPFDAGSCRMDECGKYLVIRTSHEMYTSDDGYNHQANVTIQVDIDAMTITDSYTDVMNTNLGYVSHSFNQFIKVENNKIVSVDHGDAHPRSIALLKYQTDISTGKFVPDYFNSPCSVVNVLEFPGEIGQNTTGATVGGFEISGSKYIVAGNSVVQDSDNLTRRTRNVFVAAVDKISSEVSINWLTSYEEGDGTTSTPHMVKVSDDKYIVLWSRDNKVYYTLVNGSGVKSGEIYSFNGNLSDCVPVISDGKLVWYVWDENIITFYDINVSDLSKNNHTEIVNGHHYENKGDTDVEPETSTNVFNNEAQVKVNTLFVQKGNKYKVTKSGKSGQAEVIFVSAGKNKKSVTIPKTVTTKGVKCKVTAISAKAFYKNKKLTKVVIGKNIKTIGEKAFYKCKKLKKITVKSKVLKKVGKQAVKGINKKAIIKVPKKKLKAYKKLFGKKSGFVKTMKIKK